MDLRGMLAEVLRGEVETSPETLRHYAHDASLFELRPKAVVFPRDAADVGRLVAAVAKAKVSQPTLSLTARSAGTDMSGGAINDSIIVDLHRHLTAIESIGNGRARVQPGVLYRDFEQATLAHGLLLPSYPASRELCTVGGMVANNSGGEKSLVYGKTEDYVERLRVVLADGQEYELGPLTRAELEIKRAQTNLEGELYRRLFTLVDKNRALLQVAKPKVRKNSTGYNLWDVWDGTTFDLSQLIVGSQGTLGIVTDIEFRLIAPKPESGMLVAFLPNLNRLGEFIETVLPYQPTSFESFDDHTLGLAFKFLPSFRQSLGWKGLASLALNFLRDLPLFLRGLPKLIVLIEFEGQTRAEVQQKLAQLHQALAPFGYRMTMADSAAKSHQYWVIRRESFNLLRHQVRDRHTAPFIDDLIVAPEHLPAFLPQLEAIVAKYHLMATIAGHLGEGDFHIIPLMKLDDPKERATIEPAMREVNALVLKYHGSLSGEHNDGLVRGPFLDQMYPPEVMTLFRTTKRLFDPTGLFNPHKKVDATWNFSRAHIRRTFNE